MQLKDILDKTCSNTITPKTIADIPSGTYVVYVLAVDDCPIVVGHGKRNRARVIFDNESCITTGHIKAIFVRAYHLFGHKNFTRYIIPCDSKAQAQQIEKQLHQAVGGNSRKLPETVRTHLFRDVTPGTPSDMVLRMAFSSAFDGISDLKHWRKEGILNDDIWDVVGHCLQLKDPKI